MKVDGHRQILTTLIVVIYNTFIRFDIEMKSTIVVSAVLLSISSVYGQDPQFTQFYANPLYTNPALAGTGYRDETPAGRITTNFRSQWPGLPGNFKTFCLGWDQPLEVIHGALGVQYMTNVMGSGFITINEVNAQYAYARANKKQTFQYRIGGRFSYVSAVLDFTKLLYGDQLDSVHGTFPPDPNYIPPSSLSVHYPNFGLGILLQGQKWNAGIQIANAIEPNNSFYQNPDQILPKRIGIHGGYCFNISNKFSLIPQTQFMKQRKFTDLLIGLNANHGNFIYGIWFRQSFGQYRNSDAIAGTVGFNHKGFRLIYSYDFTVSDGRSAIPSSHEISLRYCWKTKQKAPLLSQAIN